MVKHHLWKLIVAVALAATLTAPGVSATSTVFQSPQPEPPPNDNFSSATVITSLPINDSVDMTYATTESNEPQPCNWASQTVWFSYTPTVNEAVRVTLSGFYDTNLALYQAYGPDITNLSGMGCASWNSPSLTLDAVAGTTYYFQVGKIWGGGGTAQLNVELVLPPANDNFESATVVSGLPFNDFVDTIAATVQAGEPTPSCEYGTLGHTVWYVFTPSDTGSVSLNINPSFTPVYAAYSGDTLTGLTELGCHNYGGTLMIRVQAGTKYYFQVGGFYDEGGTLQFYLEATPPPYPNFDYYPYDPNTFDAVTFNNYSWDPANAGIDSTTWDFGDGATATEPWNPSHRYAKDGDYTVKLTVTTPDGRTASTTRTVQVKTHDVAITKFSAPQSASAGQTRQLVVGINSKVYAETVRVEFYKSVPGGYTYLGYQEQSVPVRSANRTTNFQWSYTFTKDDATIGKVTFKAVAMIPNARDALPADNESIASPTKVAKK
jgi:PKD repeat protein